MSGRKLVSSEPSEEIIGWLQGLADLGCTFIELKPDAKKPVKKLESYVHMVHQRGVSSALGWLRKGSGVAIMPRRPLWVLDADSLKAVEWIEALLLDAQVVPLTVRTPSGGAHFYFLFPASFPLERLKCHVCHPLDADGVKLEIDFKLCGITAVVAPGTVRKEKQYTPLAPWRQPPVVDPQMFLPKGEFWKPQDTRLSLTNPRPRKDRLAAGRAYVASPRTPVSVSGNHGSRTLSHVVAHLVSWHRLSPETACNLLTHGLKSWNSRCTDKETGKPYKWTRAEILGACKAAVGGGSAYGRKQWILEQARQEMRAKVAAYVGMLKASLVRTDGHRVPIQRAHRVFGWFGLPDVTITTLGDEYVKQGVGRVVATRKKIMCIPGLDIQSMEGRILNAKREEKGTMGCPLLQGNNQSTELPKCGNF